MPFKPGNKEAKKKGKHKKTIEKEKAEELMKQRIMAQLNPLLNAQFTLAKGCSFLFKQELPSKKFILVEDKQEILDFLNGVKKPGIFYYITTKEPDNMAIDSMFNRAFGKAPQAMQITGPDGQGLILNIIQYGNNDPLSMGTRKAPAPDTPEPGKIQDTGLAPKSEENNTASKPIDQMGSGS